MAAYPTSNGDIFGEKKGKVSREGNKDDGGDDKIHVPKHKYDGDIIITPNNESYSYKKEDLTCGSVKEVENYEKDGTLSKRKRKEKETINVEEVEKKLSKKAKEEAEINRIRVEKFLAEAHYNLLHWFDDK
ncbi:unnamed protein product [Lathyrus oleraceus]